MDRARSSKHVYRVQGFTCANCAGTYEENVKRLDGVEDAKVNFGASKITVYGETTIKELEKAGSFENLKVRTNNEKDYAFERPIPFWKTQYHTIIAFLLVLLGIGLRMNYGEDHMLTVLAFVSSMIIGGYSLFRVGITNLLRWKFDMKTLMTVAVIGAAIIGEWTEGAIVVILFAISEALERFSMDKARQSIRSLMDIAPKKALVKREDEELLLDVDEIRINDRLIVKPGEKIPMDGVVVAGRSSVNQSAITGESIPAMKGIDDDVFAGTLNEEGMLEVRVTRRVEDTTIAKIIHLVEEAQEERAPSQAFIDRFAKYYTPFIMVIAALIAIGPPLFFEASWEVWIYQGLAILVVGCPCALVISTPVAIVTAIGNAARNGVLIKGGIYLEEAGTLDTIAFDKTGTLTKGVPAVTDLKVYDNHEELKLLTIAATLEKNSQHPIARAIIQRAEELQSPYHTLKVESFRSVTGKGVQGTISKESYYIGNPKWLQRELTGKNDTIWESDIKELQSQGKTVMIVGKEDTAIGLIAVSDEVRESSRDVIRSLHKLGQKTVMLTGDNQATAEAIGDQIGVSDRRAELLPEEKLSVIKELRKRGQRVAMVGDGVNDAPALAASNMGIAMGGAGTDAALETADIALMGDDLKKLPYLINLSRRSLTIIKQNIAFSISIKVLALLLVAPGWLTLWIAILADMGATLLVTLNGMRLVKVKKETD
ncbi:heavy metal translocating P-type ATPase [Alkalihalophilus lindianensis]|uniref:Cd(2+)-exporting ATPase n=1 Tax=Alkalihalophilus lindianensis TaxID=1630542 RepID=A0ABU3XEM2_9BACI|nr:heavy metal translocating P-type ATPase [Alkalihalophilus lindianensis]MDV2686326.1 heavy metal translocating P-type ATPase [Alkalihalophilus lindianensis]